MLSLPGLALGIIFSVHEVSAACVDATCNSEARMTSATNLLQTVVKSNRFQAIPRARKYHKVADSGWCAVGKLFAVNDVPQTLEQCQELCDNTETCQSFILSTAGTKCVVFSSDCSKRWDNAAVVPYVAGEAAIPDSDEWWLPCWYGHMHACSEGAFCCCDDGFSWDVKTEECLVSPVPTETEACTDTAGWTNGNGFTCTDYATHLDLPWNNAAGAWCANGAPSSDSQWTVGSSYNYPETHCCACGGGTPAPLQCDDTPGWLSSTGKDCAHYESKGWCANGAVVKKKQAGAKKNDPELNCCICGKTPVTDTPTLKPTETPTEKPTEAPTPQPTEAPTPQSTEARVYTKIADSGWCATGQLFDLKGDTYTLEHCQQICDLTETCQSIGLHVQNVRCLGFSSDCSSRWDNANIVPYLAGEAAAPTIEKDPEMNNKKCGIWGDEASMANRLFKLTGGAATETACKQACVDSDDCVAMSGQFGEWCIGCKAQLDSVHDGAVAYAKKDATAPTTPSPTPSPGESPTPQTVRYPSDLMFCIAGEAELKTREMSPSTYDDISSAMEQLYDALSTKCEKDSCEQADFSGCVLRMAGHDFMDFDPINQRGGSDGCVDFEDPDNKGLECLAEGEHGVSLLVAYQDFCTKVSLADFLVISAEALMSLSRTKHGLDAIDFKSRFKFGRKTAQTCGFNLALPNPEESCPATETTFINQMGLDWKGSAALMGVHTLGRAQSKNSGYEGHWSDPINSRIFNNNYFVSLVIKGWMPQKTNWVHPLSPKKATDHFQNKGFHDSSQANVKTQWTRSDGGLKAEGFTPKLIGNGEMMLNTDMCLMFYNGHMQPVKAATDECCAWIPNSRYAKSRDYYWNLTKGTTKKWLNNIKQKEGTLCGRPLDIGLGGGANIMHQGCCASVTFRNCGNCQPNLKSFDIDFGEECNELPVVMNGPAEMDVLMFAYNETYWLEEFLVAWQKSTENGATELEKLG